MIQFYLLCFLTIGLNAQAPAGKAETGTNYGDTTNINGSASINELTNLMVNKDSLEVKVIGRVVDVCEFRGCFMYLESSIGNIYVKTKDDAFFVPIALNGKNVLVQGIARKENDKYYILARGILVL